MQYGLNRAVPMSILGFLLGALLTILIRSLQTVDPAWDPELGVIAGGVIATIFFVWSMGAFDPKMSAHAEEVHDADESHAIAVAQVQERSAAEVVAMPRSTTGERLERLMHRLQTFKRSENGVVRFFQNVGSIIAQLFVGLALLTVNVFAWARSSSGIVFQITTIVLIILLAIGFFATQPGGFLIRVSNDPLASVSDNGYFTMELFGQNVVFTELTFFVIFIIFTVFSLAVIGGMIALLMYFLAQNVKEVKNVPPTAAQLQPPAPARWASRAATWLLNRLPEPPQPRSRK